MSQSELARRIGISQAAVNKLASGSAYGSKHIHKIARELGTTPAYLMGETDDPTSDTPDAPDLTADEQRFLAALRTMDAKDRAALKRLMSSMAGKDVNPDGP